MQNSRSLKEAFDFLNELGTLLLERKIFNRAPSVITVDQFLEKSVYLVTVY